MVSKTGLLAQHLNHSNANLISGVFSGVLISVMAPVVAHLSPDDKIGARLGSFYSLSAIGVFTGTPTAGAFIREGTKSEYEHMIVYAVATMAMAALLILLSRWLYDRNMLSKW
jgi:predicted MFS family arabinose efflux permease